MTRKLPLVVGSFAVLAAGAAMLAMRADAPDKTPPAREPVIAAHASPVVLELFTSQGCSSCPPADELVAALARERPDLLVISRPVTYWNRLGWTDTLAREENTQLQRAYAARGIAGYNGVYTPQAVLDGRGGAVGSKAREIGDLATAARAHDAARPGIAVESGIVTITGAPGGAGELSLVALDAHESVAIGSGENGNRKLGYTNIVRDEFALGRWTGGRQSFALPADYRAVKDADRFALLLREGTAGPILAARQL